MILTLPWPPSINRYYRAVNERKIIAKVGRQYKEEVAKIILANKVRHDLPLRGRLYVAVKYHPPTRRKYDTDNFLKPLYDAMEVEQDAENGVYLNDEQIDWAMQRKAEIMKPGRVIVRILEIDWTNGMDF